MQRLVHGETSLYGTYRTTRAVDYMFRRTEYDSALT